MPHRPSCDVGSVVVHPLFTQHRMAGHQFKGINVEDVVRAGVMDPDSHCSQLEWMV